MLLSVFVSEMLGKSLVLCIFLMMQTQEFYSYNHQLQLLSLFRDYWLGHGFGSLNYAFDKAMMASFSHASELGCTQTFQVVTISPGHFEIFLHQFPFFLFLLFLKKGVVFFYIARCTNQCTIRLSNTCLILFNKF